jgi:hypothetical protein
MKYIQNFPLLLTIKTLLLSSFFMTYSQHVLADKVDDFIQKIRVSSYDCPDDQFIPQVDEYLKLRSVSPEQLIQVKVHKSQEVARS